VGLLIWLLLLPIKIAFEIIELILRAIFRPRHHRRPPAARLRSDVHSGSALALKGRVWWRWLAAGFRTSFREVGRSGVGASAYGLAYYSSLMPITSSTRLVLRSGASSARSSARLSFLECYSWQRLAAAWRTSDSRLATRSPSMANANLRGLRIRLAPRGVRRRRTSSAHGWRRRLTRRRPLLCELWCSASGSFQGPSEDNGFMQPPAARSTASLTNNATPSGYASPITEDLQASAPAIRHIERALPADTLRPALTSWRRVVKTPGMQ